MAQKEGVEHASKKTVSIPKKKLITSKVTPKATHKAKSQSLFVPAKKAVLFPSRMDLSNELRNDINKKWDDCWPVSTLRPLALIDLLCYLLFIKKLEEKRLITGSLTRIARDNTVGKELTWSSFKDLNDHDLHTLFTCENGVIDLIKNYGLTNLQYSQFLKEPLLLTPSVSLLFNVVNIIKIMEAERSTTRIAIFEFLLNKAEIEAQSGQVYAPDKIVKLVVELMQPSKKDSIWDPSAGNGSLLINSAKYIAIHKAAQSNNFTDDFFGDDYNGIECDPVQLRIAAMNMIMNGIEDPKLGGINSFSNAHINVCEQSTLVISNLYFNGAYDRKVIAGKTSLVESGRSEIHFLNFILNKLKIGGRAAVIVPEYILSNFTAEMIAMRQRIIENYKLAAVISLANKSESLFSGAGILIFAEMTTDLDNNVWFYKLKAGAKKKEAASISANEICKEENQYQIDELTDIINRWKNLAKENIRTRTDDSFYVSLDEIKNCNYTLCFNQYRKIEREPQPYVQVTISIINKEITKDVSREANGRLNIARIKVPGNLPAAYKKAFIIFNKQVFPAVKLISLQLIEKTDFLIKGALVKLKLRKRFWPGITKFPPYLAPLLLIGVISLFFYFEVFRNSNYPPSIVTAKTNIPPWENKSNQVIPTHVTDSKAKPILSQEQIKAIIYDSTTIINYDGQASDLSNPGENSNDELQSNDIADIVTANSPGEKPDEKTTNDALSVKYTVRDTTFFHNQPDDASIRKTYLDPLNNKVLVPIKDKNGFIYIVYTNQFGRTSRGWINKKDLIQLR
ncbi:MAG TPA: N-6 DNA methylase [Ginsengibacter sp.]